MVTSGSVLFVGVDLCARTDVLASRGSKVLRCECGVEALREALMKSAVDAVLFQCTPEPPSGLLLATARVLTSAPLVLFADGISSYNLRDFDAVVPALCSPCEWLPQIAEAIAAHPRRAEAKPPRAAVLTAEASALKNGS